MSGALTRTVLKTLDRLAPARGAAHLLTGERGEEEAYFYLRQLIIVSHLLYRAGFARHEFGLYLEVFFSKLFNVVG